MRKVLLLGATGSIGSQSLDILKNDPQAFEVVGFSVGHQIDKIPSLLSEFPSVKHVCVIEQAAAEALKKQYPDLSWHFGDEGLKELIQTSGADLVENALVGFAGLVPSITALQENKILCLANKESLVVGGAFIERLLRANKGKLIPIDSEHVALAKLLAKARPEEVDKLVITASGGSLRDRSRSELGNVTPEMALNHPTWKMGAKITIDSATMMNKGFEVIEAAWLYHYPLDRIEILMHDESHVHSLLLLKDGSYLADISEPDMRTPIKWALYEGKVEYEVYQKKKLSEFGPYHFHQFDPERYPAVNLALNAYKQGGTAPAILNAANEVAVHAFLDGKIPFLDIEREVEFALSHLQIVSSPSLRDVLAADALTRLYVSQHIERKRF